MVRRSCTNLSYSPEEESIEVLGIGTWTNGTQSMSSVPTSIQEPPPHGLGAAGADKWGGFPGTFRGRICLSQRSHKLFINSDLVARQSIFAVQGTAGEPG